MFVNQGLELITTVFNHWDVQYCINITTLAVKVIKSLVSTVRCVISAWVYGVDIVFFGIRETINFH